MTHDPEAFVDTPLGRLRVWAVNEHTIHAATLPADRKRQPDYQDNPDAQRCAEHLRINRVRYTLSLELVTDDQADQSRWHPVIAHHQGWAVPSAALRLRRADTDHAGTQSADDQVCALVAPAIGEWANSPAGTVLRLRAEASRVEAQITLLKATINAKREELEAAYDHRAELRSRLADVTQRGGECQ